MCKDGISAEKIKQLRIICMSVCLSACLYVWISVPETPKLALNRKPQIQNQPDRSLLQLTIHCVWTACPAK